MNNYGENTPESFTSILDKMPESGHRVVALLDNGQVQEA